MKQDIIQSSTKEHLIKNNGSPQLDSHLHSLNSDSLNTVILGDKISKNNFPDMYANFTEMANGIDQLNSQMATFSKQSQLLGLMGDQSDKSQQIDKVVQALTQSRDKMIQQSEQLALTIKGTQFFNTVDLEDYALINNKGLSSLSGKEMRDEQIKLFKAIHGDDTDIPSNEDIHAASDDSEEEQPQEQPQEEGEV